MALKSISNVHKTCPYWPVLLHSAAWLDTWLITIIAWNNQQAVALNSIISISLSHQNNNMHPQYIAKCTSINYTTIDNWLLVSSKCSHVGISLLTLSFRCCFHVTIYSSSTYSTHSEWHNEQSVTVGNDLTTHTQLPRATSTIHKIHHRFMSHIHWILQARTSTIVFMQDWITKRTNHRVVLL